MKENFGSASIILVVACFLDILKKLNLNGSDCLEMPELEENEAKSLFLNCHVDLSSRQHIDEVLIERCHFFKGDGKSQHYHSLALKVLTQQLG